MDTLYTVYLYLLHTILPVADNQIYTKKKVKHPHVFDMANETISVIRLLTK
jgi:hypothetical protein